MRVNQRAHLGHLDVVADRDFVDRSVLLSVCRQFAQLRSIN
jgi:hypothetical protein